VIAIILLLVTFVFAVIVMRNFRRGLKESSLCLVLSLSILALELIATLVDKNQAALQYTSQHGSEHHRRAMSKTLNRMSIS